MLKIIIKTPFKLFRTTNPAALFCFCQKAPKLPSYLPSDQIQSSLAPQAYQQITTLLTNQEQKLTLKHQQRLAKVKSMLSDEDKSRIDKICQLMGSLNESQAEYVRMRLLQKSQFGRIAS